MVTVFKARLSGPAPGLNRKMSEKMPALITANRAFIPGRGGDNFIVVRIMEPFRSLAALVTALHKNIPADGEAAAESATACT